MTMSRHGDRGRSRAGESMRSRCRSAVPRIVWAEGVCVDVANADTSLPQRGDGARGWHRHWRRGLIGSIQDWAAGSRPRVVFMLAEMAHYFEVEREVCSAYAE